MDLRVVNRPEAMEHQTPDVPLSNRFHFQIGLVSNDMIDKLQIDLRQNLVQLIVGVVRLEAGKEESFVSFAVDQSVSRVTILKIEKS